MRELLLLCLSSCIRLRRRLYVYSYASLANWGGTGSNPTAANNGADDRRRRRLLALIITPALLSFSDGTLLPIFRRERSVHVCPNHVLEHNPCPARPPLVSGVGSRLFFFPVPCSSYAETIGKTRRMIWMGAKSCTFFRRN